MGRIYLGTMGWSYRFWDLYPPGTSPDGFLKEYAKNFKTVEINSTFYRIPGAEMVEHWTSQTPEDFVFAAKFPRVITHIKMLKDCETEKEIFMKRISLLGHKMGPLLLQFPPGFGPDRFDLLESFLSDLPAGYRYAVEVRNKKWLDTKFISMLGDHGTALVLTEKLWLEDLTSDFTYIRLEGDRKSVDGTLGKVEKDMNDEIKEWAGRIRKYLDIPVDVYVYFSKMFSGYPPADVKMLLEFLCPKM